jgi:hypothetical protein
MPVFETYASRAAAAARVGTRDVYKYDALPAFLRKQISQIFTDCIGPGWNRPRVRYFDDEPRNANATWSQIAKVMDREVKSFALPETHDSYHYGHCMTYLRDSDDVTGVLSLVEICALVMANLPKNDPGAQKRYAQGATARSEEGIVELNQRFLQAGVGYQFENGQIIRVDSQYVHAEVIKEALRLLNEPGFDAANEEFMKAHRHLRDGNRRDANTAALRSMESVLKVICGASAWTYEKTDTVERLLAVVRREGLFPDYLEGYFNNLMGVMKAGVPKIRDREGGHGAAPGDAPVPDHIGAFALHLTAANIVMLVKAHRAINRPAR